MHILTHWEFEREKGTTLMRNVIIALALAIAAAFSTVAPSYAANDAQGTDNTNWGKCASEGFKKDGNGPLTENQNNFNVPEDGKKNWYIGCTTAF